MRRLLIPLLALWPALWPSPGQSEPYPAYDSLSVNDFADLLPEASETRIAAELDELRNRTGIEMTVVTLTSRASYDLAESLEAFATRLFNGWGIGDATRNDGILILVLDQDRETRIELGSGYNPEYDIPAQDIVNRVMLPEFREGRMAEGIEAGTTATIRDIAERHAEGLPVATSKETGSGSVPFVMIAMALVTAGLALRHRIWGAMGALARCPSCGHRGVQRAREITRVASRDAQGAGVTRQSCPSCGWREDKDFTLPRRRSRSGGGSFGGGRSSGGGASGRW